MLLHLLLEQTKRLGVEIIVQLLAIHSVFLQMTSRKGSSLVHWPPYSLDSPNSFNVVLLGLKELLLSPMRCSRSTRLFAVTPSNKLIDVLSSVLSCLLESIEPLSRWQKKKVDHLALFRYFKSPPPLPPTPPPPRVT